MSCQGASLSTKEPIVGGWTGRHSPWWPSDSEELSGGEVVDGGTDKRLMGLDIGSGKNRVLRGCS
jgi:hypothetical protein